MGVDERIWLKHTEHGGTFACPAGAVDEWRDMGWEPCDPPEEPNPVVAELLAAQQTAAEASEPTPMTSRKGGTDTTAQE